MAEQANRNRGIEGVTANIGAVGFLLLAVCLLGVPLGFLWGWVELVALGFMALILLLLALPFLVGLRSYSVTYEVDRSRVVAEQEFSVFVHVTNISKKRALPGMIILPLGEDTLEVQVPFLNAGAIHTQEILVSGLQRSIVTAGPAKTWRTDPLNIFHREKTWGVKHKIFVHPKVAKLVALTGGFIKDLEGKASAEVVAEDFSFHALREYQPGDSRKHINWKATAKTGTLMVRQYEETKRSVTTVCLTNAAELYADGDEFELAVSVAASIVLRGLRDSVDTRFLTAGEFSDQGSRVFAREAFLDRCAGLKLRENAKSEARSQNLVAEIRAATEHFADASVAFIVCGSRAALKDIYLASFSFPANTSVVAVIADQSRPPALEVYGRMPVLSIGVLDDLPQLLARRL